MTEASYYYESEHRKVTVKATETKDHVEMLISCSKKGSLPDNEALDNWLRGIVKKHVRPNDHRTMSFKDANMTLTVENAK